jgi:hypothetical protein
MLLIYTPSITPRLRYIFSLIFNEILKIEIEITSDKEMFEYFNGAKLNYSEKKIGEEPLFHPAPLLFEKNITNQLINVFDWEGTKAFFAVPAQSVFPFDPFAAAFYLVSRYEEYLPFTEDEHGRFEAEQSLAFQAGFLQKPLVNLWAEKIKEILIQKYPNLIFPERKFEYLSTIDIDNAYAYKGKGFMRTTGALIRALAKFNNKGFIDRMKVVFFKSHDPYDTYIKMRDIKKQYNVASVYFFLVGKYGAHDKNLSITQKGFQSLIKSTADYSDVGIHPSYSSNKDPKELAIEIKNLSRVLNHEITKSRQHYLKMKLPETYRNLIENGIKEDYSMGFASQVGFRASICSPFYFYDLVADEATKLVLFPFAVMDATLNLYLKINPDDAISHVVPLIKEIKSVNGMFISLWHNESICNEFEWKGWQGIYEQVVKTATEA